ncbi:MAG: LysM peptidoglycan-binding domain-containing protein [Anaerolineales bacterium]|uniref:LysM peptidoglycan-binding domain-containing protein n=1 Tax=Candidatus Desulfolinea nitratireducens TaxID=2841698 RepID=A0A8J6NIX8_9CHLR|nr:LysM peptidoglycan-binding domain-containing protein [Candidatus Desulfolinea nitratireducens]
MPQKKSRIILLTAFIMIALVSVGCERSYAPIDESLATPTIEGNSGFPEALPADMDEFFESGALTVTALAMPSSSAAEPTLDLTAAPEANVDLTPAAGLDPTETPDPATATGTLPVISTTDLPPTSIVGRPASYSLKKGEFPYCIARRFNIDPGVLLTLNNISAVNAQNYQPGVTLSIPQSGAAFPPPRALHAHPVTYVVPQTTTVYGVACYFGDIDPSAIMTANTIPDPDNITAGTTLQIP